MLKSPYLNGQIPRFVGEIVLISQWSGGKILCLLVKSRFFLNPNGGFQLVMGVPRAIIHFRLGFSLTNNPAMGVPPWLWNPPTCSLAHPPLNLSKLMDLLLLSSWPRSSSRTWRGGSHERMQTSSIVIPFQPILTHFNPS